APRAPRASGMWQPWQIARYKAAPSLSTKWPSGANAPPWLGAENTAGSSATQQDVASAHVAASTSEATGTLSLCVRIYISHRLRMDGDGALVQPADRIERRQDGAFLPGRQTR